MSNKLSDRVAAYEDSSNYKILPKLPLIFKVNGRAFSSTTSLLDKPFDKLFYDCLSSTAKYLCSEIEGAVLGYVYNDTIIVVARNDHNTGTATWFNNNISKLCSFTSSIATAYFNKCANHINLDVVGLPIFTSHVFPVPNITEVINSLICYQQLNSSISSQFACYYELLKKYDKQTIKKTMYGLSKLEMIELLNEEFNIKFENYNSIFRKGALCVRTYDGKMKWEMIENPVLFSTNQDFLKNNLSY